MLVFLCHNAKSKSNSTRTYDLTLKPVQSYTKKGLKPDALLFNAGCNE